MAQQGDVHLFHTENDGDIDVINGVVGMSGGLATALYLSLFGGNENDGGGQDTSPSWWGNIDEALPERKYRSATEYLLRGIPATSNNLLRIEDAVRRDTKWLLTSKVASSIVISVTIPAINSVKILIKIEALGEESSFEFVENWKVSAFDSLLLTRSFPTVDKPYIEYLISKMGVRNDGTVFLDNTGASGTTYDSDAYASDVLYLNGIDQEFDVELPHTLGSANPNNTFSSGTSGAGNTVSTVANVTTVHCEASTDQAYHPVILTTSTLPSDSLAYKVTFSVEITSGTAYIDKIEYSNQLLIWGETKSIQETTSTGTYEYSVVGFYGATNQFNLVFNGQTENTFDATVTVTIKEVTNSSAYYLKYDQATKEFVTLSNIAAGGTLPVSTVYTETASGQLFTALTVAPTPADLTYLNANLHAIPKLLDGETVSGLSFVLADIYSCYLGNDKNSGAYLQDLRQNLGSELVTTPDCSSTTGFISVQATIASDGSLITVTTDATLTETIMFFDAFPAIGVTVKFVIDVDTMPENGTLIWELRDEWLATESGPLVLGLNEVIVSVPLSFTIPRFIVNGKNLLSANSFKINTFSTKEVQASEIQNYTAACRTTYENVNYGMSNLLLKQDATGRFTGMADDRTFEIKDPNLILDTQWSGTGYGYVEEVYHDGTDWVHFLYLANGNRYKNSVSDGTFTMKALIVGTIHLDEHSFDGVESALLRRGVFRVEDNELVSQAQIDAVYGAAVTLYPGKLSPL